MAARLLAPPRRSPTVTLLPILQLSSSSKVALSLLDCVMVNRDHKLPTDDGTNNSSNSNSGRASISRRKSSEVEDVPMESTVYGATGVDEVSYMESKC